MTAHDTESRAIARRAQPGQIAHPDDSWDDFKILTPRGLVELPQRLQSIATISAGYKDEKGMPVVSRDGTICLTDDDNHPAHALREALRETNGKRLTIAFNSNNRREIYQQHLALRSRTRRQAFGDAEQITEVGENGARRVTYYAENPDKYLELASKMKCETFFFFLLAYWDDDGLPQFNVKDGVATYRLRTTSVNSAMQLINQIDWYRRHNGGNIVGLPLDLFLETQSIPDSTGTTRRVPIWKLVLVHPDGGTTMLPQVREVALQNAQALSLPAPSFITLDELEQMDDVADDDNVVDGVVITEEDADLLRRGGPIANFDRFKREYFLAAGKSSYRTDEGRREFLLAYTHGRTGSLREFAQISSSRDGEKLLETVGKYAIAEIEARNERGEPTPAVEISDEDRAKLERDRAKLSNMDDEEPTFRRQRIQQPAQPPRKTVPDAATQAAVAMSGGPARLPSNPPSDDLMRPNFENGEYSPAEWRSMYVGWAGRFRKLDSAYRPLDVDKTPIPALIQELRGVIGQVDDIESSPPDVPVADEDETLVDI